MDSRERHEAAIVSHYERVWGATGTVRRWSHGPAHELPGAFRVLEFSPNDRRQMWTYATAGMSQPEDEGRLEVHIFSKEQVEGIVELLTAVAHYHRTGSTLGLGHSVNFGRAWIPGSKCDYGLISLPYLDGPSLEVLDCGDGVSVQCLWLIPITLAERRFK